MNGVKFVVGARKSPRWVSFKERANEWLISKNGEKTLTGLLFLLISFLIAFAVSRSTSL
jgi:hypothetical protein